MAAGVAPRLLLATGNPHKVAELAAALPGWRVEGFAPPEPPPPEDGASYYENALIKARHARRFAPADAWVAGEDSGIEADALGGRPGLESARWAGDGVAALLAALDGAADRHAGYACELVALGPEGEELRARGRLFGAVAAEPRGHEGFGYDPILVPAGEERTVAELGDAWKSAHSHRAHAARGLRTAFELAPEVREAALHLHRHLPPPPPPLELVETDGLTLVAAPTSVAVVQAELGRDAVPAAVERARGIARVRGLDRVYWFAHLSCAPDDLGARLLRLGVPRAWEPPWEPASGLLVLARAPAPGPAAVEVSRAETYEEFVVADRIVRSVLTAEGEDHEAWEKALPELWESYRPGSPRAYWLARIAGQPVAAATAETAGPLLYLAGGATVPHARGRGAYRALVRARWDEAAAGGLGALAVHALSASRPILERLGFVLVDDEDIFLDRF